MKKLILICFTVASLSAEIPHYNGPSVTQELCSTAVQIFYNQEDMFEDMIRQGRTFEARTIAWDMDRYYDSLTDSWKKSIHYCKQSMGKAEYKKWFGYVKRKRNELKRKGWLK